MSKLMSARAVTLPCRLAKIFPTWLRLILATERFQAVPLEQMVANENDEAIRDESQQAYAQHSRNHDVVAVKQVGVIEKVAKPAADRKNLGDDHQHPGDAHRQPHTCHD